MDDRPATKQDIADLRQEIRELAIKVDAYWLASNRVEGSAARVQQLAFGLLAAGVIAILATAVTLIMRG